MSEKITCSDLAREFRQAKGIKFKLFIILFRLASLYCRTSVFRFLFLPIVIIYRFYSEVIIGIDLPVRTKIGAGLNIYHGYGLVVHGDVVIGENCVLRQGVTIGNKVNSDGVVSKCPRIGNNVEVGANSIIVGNIEIGSDVKIGAGVVVTKSIPAGSTVIGQGFRFI